MARGHPGIPRPTATKLSKRALLAELEHVDADPEAWMRVSALENDFRARMQAGIAALSHGAGRFASFKTNPYVLLVHSLKAGYVNVHQIEADLVPAKAFSSMETSTGKMIELVTLPVYGWECSPSPMASVYSALDGIQADRQTLRATTLKSGPSCLNDGMVENLADAILANTVRWASGADVEQVEFTYGVLYGTKKQSNKKDWHILRHIEEKLEMHGGALLDSPNGKWDCAFELDGVHASVTIRIGMDWWRYLGGATCALELWVALIRACVAPDSTFRYDVEEPYAVADLGDIVSTRDVEDDYNVRVLQRSQIPWLFFIARHFCDELVA